MTGVQGKAYSLCVLGGTIKFIVVFIGSLAVNQLAFAGAWNQRGGEGQVISTSSWSHAGQIFDDDYDAVPLRGFTKTETRLYIEQGVTDWLTVVGNTGFQTLNFRDGDSRFDFDGLDDIEIGAQIKTYSREGLATAVRVSYVVDSQLDNRAIDVLSGGNQFEARGLIGQSSETLIGDFFYDAQFAIRTEDFDKIDETQAALTLGYKPTHRWLFMSQSYGIVSAEETVSGFRVPEQVQISTHVSAAHQYRPGRYIQLGVGQTVFGRNIVKERSVFMGLWTEY